MERQKSGNLVRFSALSVLTYSGQVIYVGDSSFSSLFVQAVYAVKKAHSLTSKPGLSKGVEREELLRVRAMGVVRIQLYAKGFFPKLKNAAKQQGRGEDFEYFA